MGPGGGRDVDRWALQAVALLLVVPAAVSNAGPLDALRVRLLPVPARTLVLARVLAGAPLRLALVPPALAAGTVTAVVAAHAPDAERTLEGAYARLVARGPG